MNQRPLPIKHRGDRYYSSIGKLTAGVVCAFAILESASPAAINVYPDLASFLSASGPVLLESFEQTPLLAKAFHPPVDIGPFAVTASGQTGNVNFGFGFFETGPSTGQHPTHGSRYLAWQANTLKLTFSQPIMALSLDFIDFGDIGPTTSLSMSTSAGDLVIIKQNGPDSFNGNEIFFGFKSDIPLTEVTFESAWGHGDNVAVDSVRYASVPEPSIPLLCASGGVWLLWRRRRK